MCFSSFGSVQFLFFFLFLFFLYNLFVFCGSFVCEISVSFILMLLCRLTLKLQMQMPNELSVETASVSVITFAATCHRVIRPDLVVLLMLQHLITKHNHFYRYLVGVKDTFLTAAVRTFWLSHCCLCDWLRHTEMLTVKHHLLLVSFYINWGFSITDSTESPSSYL